MKLICANFLSDLMVHAWELTACRPNSWDPHTHSNTNRKAGLEPMNEQNTMKNRGHYSISPIVLPELR